METDAIRIDPELEALIPPLRDDERQRLEESLATDGCRDPLIVWEEESILVDGHNRLRYCRENGLKPAVFLKSFADREEVREWMLLNQTSRRNLTADQFRYLLGKAYNRAKAEAKKVTAGADQIDPQTSTDRHPTAERLAKEFGVGSATVRRAGKRAAEIDKDEERRNAILQGERDPGSKESAPVKKASTSRKGLSLEDRVNEVVKFARKEMDKAPEDQREGVRAAILRTIDGFAVMQGVAEVKQ